MTNWFATLNDALTAEGLLAAWDCSSPPIAYGETRAWTWDDGSRHGHYVTVYRNERGLYERPIHYSR
jgi:hypothetical protein